MSSLLTCNPYKVTDEIFYAFLQTQSWKSVCTEAFRHISNWTGPTSSAQQPHVASGQRAKLQQRFSFRWNGPTPLTASLLLSPCKCFKPAVTDHPPHPFPSMSPLCLSLKHEMPLLLLSKPQYSFIKLFPNPCSEFISTSFVLPYHLKLYNNINAFACFTQQITNSLKS